MSIERTLEAFCETCSEPTEHRLMRKDASACACTVCGTQQRLMVPI